MKGWIDDQHRAMVEVMIAVHPLCERKAIHAWIDTAFDGHLVLPKSLIDQIGLELLAETEAILADGSIAKLKCFYGVVDWLDESVPVQVVENEGQLPLVGTGLLSCLELRINYREKICTLS